MISIKQGGGQLVPTPRSTDAIGAALRRSFGCLPLPDDMQRLLGVLDRNR